MYSLNRGSGSANFVSKSIRYSSLKRKMKELKCLTHDISTVSAAPCKWMWDHITHTPPTTPPTPTAPTTPMTTTTPDLIEDFARLKKKKVKQWDQLVNDWRK
uniref:SFRICE_004803 n=1 Tax=Spodoptera frugiperda TaxID=7108 RepID=A0A2H1WNA2_SPOFR